MKAQRLLDTPIITPETHPGVIEHDHANINGPSLIRVPDWLPNALGKYYLYFAHHQGTFIRLAYADDLTGPWTLHAGGALQIRQTPFEHHIASPDVHVDQANRRLIMFYHGCCVPNTGFEQETCVAYSTDGLAFESRATFLTESYLRAFRRGDGWIGVAKGGRLYQTQDIEEPWQRRGWLDYSGRHWAGWIDGDTWHLIYSRWGDAPEHLLYATIDLSESPRWRLRDRVSLLRPERPWEGADKPIGISLPGSVHEPVHELRDPDVFEENGRRYLTYSVAGEAGIAIAELIEA